MKKEIEKQLKAMTKQERYKYNMHRAGFNQHSIWVHVDDIDAVKKYVERKRKARTE